MWLLFAGIVYGFAHSIDCQYSYYSAPMCRIQLGLQADGTPENFALITMQDGRTHTESITLDNKSGNEWVHAWLSKENPDNAIEMIVYNQPQALGQSKIVNAKSPFAKEIWGTCTAH